MSRWLLNTFPTWVLAVMVVGGFAAMAAIGSLFVRKRFPAVAEGKYNDLAGRFLGVLMGMFGLVLGFTIVNLYTDFKEANKNVQAEAMQLTQLYRDTRAFPPDVRGRIDSILIDYVHTVVQDEWPLMREGRSSDQASDEIEGLYTLLQSYEPETGTQHTFYGQAVSKLDAMILARRTRLVDAQESLPREFLGLILVGAFVVMGFSWFFGSEHPTAQTIMVAAVSGLVGFNIFLAILLDHPFSGEVAVSNEVFRHHVLNVLE